MRPRRAGRGPWILGAAALVLVAVLLRVTVVVLELEAKEHGAQASAEHQERLRLSLWRMDSWFAPRLAREAARPYFEYQAYYPQERAYTRMLQPLDAADVLTASPLLTFTSEIFPLHFQLGTDGVLQSPQSPQGLQLELALNTCIGPESADTQLSRLGELARRVGFTELSQATAAAELRMAALDERLADGEREGASTRDPLRPDGRAGAGRGPTFGPPAPTGAAPSQAGSESAQSLRNTIELSKRARQAQTLALNYDGASSEPAMAESLADAVGNSAGSEVRTEAGREAGTAARVANDARVGEAAADAPTVEVGPLVPVWRGPDELYYLRRVQVGDQPLVQGMTVDWPVLRGALLAEVADLLPGAQLVPADAPAAGGRELGPGEDGLALATVPARLAAPAPPTLGPAGLTPVRWALLLSWVAVALATGAAAHTLAKSQELGERKSRFASAVTHELRTPLTTFRLYTEMLADGMVPDEARRAEYLATLRDESLRLSRLVENVLGYARLEEGRTALAPVQTTVGELLDGLTPLLARRAADAGLRLTIDAGELAQHALLTDPTVVGQVLFNLVDNAAKYAAGAADGRVELRAERAAGRVQLVVRDHGPGVAPAAARTVFEAWHRHAPDAVPGVGLGLALSRGLAHELGGELLLDADAGDGASFRLLLPG